MKAARVSIVSRSDAMKEVQHEEVSTPIRKTMIPADHPGNRELRRRRDLVWLLLSKHGFNAVEIAHACTYANRSARQIQRRLEQLRRLNARLDRG